MTVKNHPNSLTVCVASSVNILFFLPTLILIENSSNTITTDDCRWEWAALKTILCYVLVLFDSYFYWVAFPYILLFETLGFKFKVILCCLWLFWLLFLIPSAFLNLATLQLFFDLYRALPTSLSPMVSYLFIRCTMNFSQDMQNFSEVIKKLRWNVRYVTVNGWQLVVLKLWTFPTFLRITV